MTNVDYTDDTALLVNTPVQAESLQNSLMQTAGGIDIYVNADKTEFIYFQPEAAISTLSDMPLKLVDYIYT